MSRYSDAGTSNFHSDAGFQSDRIVYVFPHVPTFFHR